MAVQHVKDHEPIHARIGFGRESQPLLKIRLACLRIILIAG
jgi:hypothetical protein